MAQMNFYLAMKYLEKYALKLEPFKFAERAALIEVEILYFMALA
jgi:hypothetical protein